MICITCDHDCHCGDSCDALPAQGGCGCRTCEHKEEEPMARKNLEMGMLAIQKNLELAKELFT